MLRVGGDEYDLSAQRTPSVPACANFQVPRHSIPLRSSVINLVKNLGLLVLPSAHCEYSSRCKNIRLSNGYPALISHQGLVLQQMIEFLGFLVGVGQFQPFEYHNGLARLLYEFCYNTTEGQIDE